MTQEEKDDIRQVKKNVGKITLTELKAVIIYIRELKQKDLWNKIEIIYANGFKIK